MGDSISIWNFIHQIGSAGLLVENQVYQIGQPLLKLAWLKIRSRRHCAFEDVGDPLLGRNAEAPGFFLKALG
jgi:hypothetical protein